MRGLLDQLGPGLPPQDECHHQQAREQEHRNHVDRHHERDPRQQSSDEGSGDRRDALRSADAGHAAHALLLAGGDVGDVGLGGREDRCERRAEEHSADEDEQDEQRRLTQGPVDAHGGDNGEEHHGRRADRQGGDEDRLAPPRLGAPPPDLAGEDDHDRCDADREADLPLVQPDLPRQRRDHGVERRLSQVGQEDCRQNDPDLRGLPSAACPSVACPSVACFSADCPLRSAHTVLSFPVTFRPEPQP